MLEDNVDHYRIVKDALEGKREIDEQTLSSLGVFEERLERLKKLDQLFSDVDFSAAVRKLISQGDRIVVC
jgi:hypothetical protein